MRVNLLLVALLLALPGAAAADRVEELIQRGEKLLDSRDFDGASSAFRRALRRSQDSSYPAVLGLARAELGLERTQEARQAARRAVELASSPEDLAMAYNVLGMAHFHHGLAEGLIEITDKEQKPTYTAREAEAAFRKVLELVGERAAPAHYSLAELLYAENRIAEARGELDLYLAAAGPSASPQSLELAECLTDITELDWGAEGVTQPKAMTTRDPEYTDRARGARIEGAVITVVIVDERGRVLCPRAIRSLPYGLTEATLAALRGWQFEPATVQGRPVKIRYILSTTFSLN
jgi:TonB family protein